jgi:hypothetical protein
MSILTRVIACTRKIIKFQVYFPVLDAIFQSRMVVGIKVLHHFVARPCLGKVTKALPNIGYGAGMALKRAVWWVILPISHLVIEG